MTLGGVILDFELAAANATDLEVGREMLQEHRARVVIRDKGHISAETQAQLWEEQRIKLVTLPGRNQRIEVPRAVQRSINQARQIVETVNDQLAEQFSVEQNHAHTFWGLCTRLYTKLTAHTLCIHINRLLGSADFLHIKHLAFPN